MGFEQHDGAEMKKINLIFRVNGSFKSSELWKKVSPEDSNFPLETTAAFIRSSDLQLFSLNLMNIITCMRRSELV